MDPVLLDSMIAVDPSDSYKLAASSWSDVPIILKWLHSQLDNQLNRKELDFIPLFRRPNCM